MLGAKNGQEGKKVRARAVPACRKLTVAIISKAQKRSTVMKVLSRTRSSRVTEDQVMGRTVMDSKGLSPPEGDQLNLLGDELNLREGVGGLETHQAALLSPTGIVQAHLVSDDFDFIQNVIRRDDLKEVH